MNEKLTDDQISQIIHRAAEIDGNSASIDRAILERTASELGISPEAVRQAEEELRGKKTEEQDRAAFVKHKWQEFFEHLVSYLAVNGFLLFIDVFKDHQINWFWYAACGWGIAIVIHFAAMFRDFGDPEVDREFHKWKRGRDKRRRRAESRTED